MAEPTEPSRSGEPALVAVLGGGQLGRMLALAGVPLGLRFRFLDPQPGASAGAVGELVVGALGDERALAAVADGATVVTYEWEGVPAEAVQFLEARVMVRPGARSLEVAQDRLTEKETFRRLGIGTPRFAAVDDADDLEPAITAVGGLPAVLKARRGGTTAKVNGCCTRGRRRTRVERPRGRSHDPRGIRRVRS